MNVKTNLRLLKRSYKKLIPGDIFAMLLPDGRYLFGRVILSDLPAAKAPMPTSNLIYIYKVQSNKKAPPPIQALKPENLLIAPEFINRMPWTEEWYRSNSFAI
jgi:hypothetical protein